MTTVITCYYDIPSKHSKESYNEWIKNFMTMNMSVVIFIDKLTIKNLIDMYPETTLRKYKFREVSDFVTSKWNWDKDYEMDTEQSVGHNQHLYKIWNEKIFMVSDIVKENPYNTDRFAWVDIGCFRDKNSLSEFDGFPNPRKFSLNKVSFLEIEPFVNTDYQSKYPISNQFKNRNTVGGTIFAGGGRALEEFRNIYENILEEADKANVFKGKDQNMYAFCCLRHPELFTLVKKEPINYDKWFSLHYMWAGKHNLHFVIVGPGIMPIPPTGWGACEILIWDYACELQKLGHKVEIINTKDLNHVISTIKGTKPDFVHIQYDDYAHIASEIASSCGCVAITSHFGYIEQRQKWGGYDNVFNRVIGHTSPNIFHFALSEGIANVYLANGINPKKVFVTPNGARSELFRYTENPKYPERSIVVGKMERRKGQYRLQHNQNVWFAGNKYDNTFDYSNPRWLGEWDKATLYDNLTDYGNLVLLSDGEADPLVVKEALMAGLGVVVSEWATANLDLTLPFITVIPEAKIDDKEFIDEAIRINCVVSNHFRNDIKEYSKRFQWSTLVEKYVKLVKNLL